MTLSIAGKQLRGVMDLSEMSRTVLAFIDGGTEWLAWAARSPSDRHDFADETQLVAAVQFGLHASSFALLPRLGLKVSPVKLMTLSLSDLRTLARAEDGDDSPVVLAQVRRIQMDHGLVTQADLASGTALLNRLGIGDAPIFQAMEFEDHLAIYELTRSPLVGEDSPLPDTLPQEAAAFAVNQGRTPLEFTDYYRLYFAQAEKLGASADTPQRRQEMAATTLATLLPLLFGHLGGPQLAGIPSPSEFAATLDAWLRKGCNVGFSRLSEGARLIVQRTDYRNEPGSAAQQLVELYISNATSFLSSHPQMTGRISQDGASIQYKMYNGSLGAELKLGSAGIISLSDFHVVRPTVSPDACI